MNSRTTRTLPLAGLILASSASLAACVSAPPPSCPIPGAKLADDLIEAGETHFAHLWRITSGGENAEAYWNFGGDRLVLQSRNPALGVDCDRIYTTPRGATGTGSGAARSPLPALAQVSNGIGTTTCAFFLPDGKRILYSSTEGTMQSCPPPPDYSRGYVWSVYPEHDIWVEDLRSGAQVRITSEWGYDAEATISPLGDRMVFTSTRSGDLELWTAGLDGTDLVQVTDSIGYDGGAFFSHDGRQLIFRSTAFAPDNREQEIRSYLELLAEWKVRPGAMELHVIDTDGSNRRQITQLGGANFAPYFFPDDSRVIFSSNHPDPRGREFDIYAIGVDGEDLEQITAYRGFDSFPCFSPDGKFLAFSSNRGGTTSGETSVYVAEWR